MAGEGEAGSAIQANSVVVIGKVLRCYNKTYIY